jgi:hypothetical protein
VCPFKGRIEYDPGEIECGLLQVPENREDPDSRFIELHFVKLNSTWDDEEEQDDDEEDSGLEPGKRDDPVIYLTGGPGAVAEGYVERFKDHGIRKHRDLYILEQRGIANPNLDNEDVLLYAEVHGLSVAEVIEFARKVAAFTTGAEGIADLPDPDDPDQVLEAEQEYKHYCPDTMDALIVEARALLGRTS